MTSLSDEIKANKARLNLHVMQRLDNRISSIELTFDHVVLYEYVMRKHEWKKKGVEGSSFIVRRLDGSHCLFILNRLSTDNFILTLDPQLLETEYQKPFILLKAAARKGNSKNAAKASSNKQKIYGLWFYREQNYNQFIQFIEQKIFGRGSNERNISSAANDGPIYQQQKSSSEEMTFMDNNVASLNHLIANSAMLEQKPQALNVTQHWHLPVNSNLSMSQSYPYSGNDAIPDKVSMEMSFPVRHSANKSLDPMKELITPEMLMKHIGQWNNY
jgi:hypothetical protein